MCIHAIPAYGIDATVPTTTMRSGVTLPFRTKESFLTDTSSEAHHRFNAFSSPISGAITRGNTVCTVLQLRQNLLDS
jgi:hypothetical protein